MNPFDIKPDKENPCIAWWSGGADSAIVCWLCIKWFKKENVRLVFIAGYYTIPDTMENIGILSFFEVELNQALKKP